MLSQVVAVRHACGGPAELALVYSYTDQPTFGLTAVDGHKFNWVAHLCREATPYEAVEYWKARAEAAEAISVACCETQ